MMNNTCERIRDLIWQKDIYTKINIIHREIIKKSYDRKTKSDGDQRDFSLKNFFLPDNLNIDFIVSEINNVMVQKINEFKDRYEYFINNTIPCIKELYENIDTMNFCSSKVKTFDDIFSHISEKHKDQINDLKKRYRDNIIDECSSILSHRYYNIKNNDYISIYIDYYKKKYLSEFKKVYGIRFFDDYLDSSNISIREQYIVCIINNWFSASEIINGYVESKQSEVVSKQSENDLHEAIWYMIISQYTGLKYVTTFDKVTYKLEYNKPNTTTTDKKIPDISAKDKKKKNHRLKNKNSKPIITNNDHRKFPDYIHKINSTMNWKSFNEPIVLLYQLLIMKINDFKYLKKLNIEINEKNSFYTHFIKNENHLRFSFIDKRLKNIISDVFGKKKYKSSLYNIKKSLSDTFKKTNKPINIENIKYLLSKVNSKYDSALIDNIDPNILICWAYYYTTSETKHFFNIKNWMEEKENEFILWAKTRAEFENMINIGIIKKTEDTDVTYFINGNIFSEQMSAIDRIITKQLITNENVISIDDPIVNKNIAKTYLKQLHLDDQDINCIFELQKESYFWPTINTSSVLFNDSVFIESLNDKNASKTKRPLGNTFFYTWMRYNSCWINDTYHIKVKKDLTKGIYSEYIIDCLKDEMNVKLSTLYGYFDPLFPENKFQHSIGRHFNILLDFEDVYFHESILTLIGLNDDNHRSLPSNQQDFEISNTRFNDFYLVKKFLWSVYELLNNYNLISSIEHGVTGSYQPLQYLDGVNNVYHVQYEIKTISEFADDGIDYFMGLKTMIENEENSSAPLKIDKDTSQSQKSWNLRDRYIFIYDCHKQGNHQ